MTLPSLPAGARLLVFYDGLCGVCDALTQRLLAADGRGALVFAPLQGETANAVRARHPVDPTLDSILVLADPGGAQERLLARSAAAFAIAAELGGWYRLLAPLRLVPRPLRDWAYDLFARHRTRFMGRLAACRVPTPEQRRRFLA